MQMRSLYRSAVAPAAASGVRAAINAVASTAPLSVWMLVIATAVALLAGWQPAQVVSTTNDGFGRALGEFALLLLPSFVISAALASRSIGGANGTASLMSPFVGAAMVCPDSAYATLSPMAGRRKLDTALGAYAGFKLLFPAGPLIVATGFGMAATPGLLAWGVVLLGGTWLTGLLWARHCAGSDAISEATRGKIDWPALAPLLLIAALLTAGAVAGSALSQWNALAYLLTPKGALAAAAVCALSQLEPGKRADVVQAGLRRTTALLFTIGAASALGAVIVDAVPFARSWPAGLGSLGAVAMLFACASLLKVLQGSSMATFAAVTAICGPMVAASGLSNAAAVYAACLGTMVAITPNDSFYWLVRSDALSGMSELASVRALALGSALQGLAGLVILMALTGTGMV